MIYILNQTSHKNLGFKTKSFIDKIILLFIPFFIHATNFSTFLPSIPHYILILVYGGNQSSQFLPTFTRGLGRIPTLLAANQNQTNSLQILGRVFFFFLKTLVKD